MKPHATCEQARTAISALLDSEEPGLDDVLLARHIDGCSACRQWRELAERVSVAADSAVAAPEVRDHKLTARVLAAVTSDPGTTERLKATLTRSHVLRTGLGLSAVGQLLLALPLLLAPVASVPTQLAWEAGALGVAVAVGFGYAAGKPQAAKAMLPTAVVLAVLFLVAGVREISGDPSAIAYHSGHLVVVLQAGLLWALTRIPAPRVHLTVGRAVRA